MRTLNVNEQIREGSVKIPTQLPNLGWKCTETVPIYLPNAWADYSLIFTQCSIFRKFPESSYNKKETFCSYIHNRYAPIYIMGMKIQAALTPDAQVRSCWGPAVTRCTGWPQLCSDGGCLPENSPQFLLHDPCTEGPRQFHLLSCILRTLFQWEMRWNENSKCW